MNKALLILSVAGTLFFASCDKESSGTINDFSNSLPAYVDLAGAQDTLEVSEGDSVALTFNMRTAIQQAVTITYSVSAPVSLTDQTVVIPRNLLKGTGSFKIPEGVVTDPSGSEYATMTVTKATTADGESLTLGRYNDATTQVKTFNIFIP
jgi:hypothetical protein